jgi:uncharacterized protein (TIGR04255 family)
MAEKRSLHFKNPPIVEAVIAVNIFNLSPTVIGSFEETTSRLEQIGYKRREIPITMHAFQMQIADGKSQVTKTDSPHGLRFDSSDGRYAVQFNLSGFVFSRLGGYQTWEEFRDEARKLWLIFIETAEPIRILSFGVRYINKLFVPVATELSNYLTVYPQLPDNVPQIIHESFMRLGMEIIEPKGVLIHQQTLLPPEKEGFATILLDNDFQFGAAEVSNDGLWAMIESVRDLKDDYFVKFLTPAMLETFDA